jgi:exopolysaccharide biosynthesis polyprenyl glycosylphosphotransferase
MKRLDTTFGLLRIPLDFAGVMLAFWLGYQVRLRGDFIPGIQLELDSTLLPAVQEYTALSLLFAGLLVFTFALSGLYPLKNADGPLREVRRLITGSLIWILLIMAYFFVTRELFFSRLVLGYSAIFSLVLLVLTRSSLNLLKRLLLTWGYGRRHVLVLGKNAISERLMTALKKDVRYRVWGPLTQLTNLKKTVRRHKIEEVLQTQEFNNMQDQDILDFCQEHHLEYRFVPDILEVERSNVDIEPLAGLPLIHLRPTRLHGWGRVYKRSVDILLSGLALIVLSPLLLLVAIGIKLDSKGPVLFSKLDDGSPVMRVGVKGKLFRFYKFRTMRHKTHNQRYTDLADKDIRKGSPLVKIKNDPRITSFGKFLRRFDIDELPQLWNVFWGQMSLIGPRPHLPEEVARYEKHHKFLLTIRPGLSGLSQTSGRSDLNFEEEVRLESYYIKYWSPWLDFKILLKTFMVVLRGHGAE